MRSSAGGSISNSRIRPLGMERGVRQRPGRHVMKMLTIGEAEGAGIYIAEGSSSLIIKAVVIARGERRHRRVQRARSS
jgi:hypothetical protein